MVPQKNSVLWIGRLISIGILFVLLTTIGCAVKGVEDGQAGIKADFGKIQDQALKPGWHFFNPIISWIEVWNTKTQELKETANVPSSEGLISSLDVSILFNVPADKVVLVRKAIGRYYVENVLEPYAREAIRNVVSGYAVKSLFNDSGRQEIGQKMLAFLKDKLDDKGIIVQDVLLRDVRLPAAFSVSIENKLRAEQESFQKEFELKKAEKDAEIEVARAKGVAQSNQIISGSIDENYLRYLWIQGLQSNNEQVIYIPTEGNIPIMEANRFANKNSAPTPKQQ